MSSEIALNSGRIGRRLLKGRTATGLALASGLVGGSAYQYITSTEKGKGIGRQLKFWSQVGPIVVDYYFRASSSSPYVRWRRYWNEECGQENSNDEKWNWKKEQSNVLSRLHEKHASTIFQLMIDLRGLYIKLGQILSVTVLPVPEPYRQRFRTLQSNVPGWEDYHEVVEPLLKREWNVQNHSDSITSTHYDDDIIQHILNSIERTPCGAASIGQAHRATLLQKHSVGDRIFNKEEDIIIKVQYPDASWQVPADIQCVGDFLELCIWTGVIEDESSARMSYEEFSRQFLSELDYELERNNLEQIYSSASEANTPYQKNKIKIVIPKVIPQLSTDKVIAMSYLEGPKIEEEARRQLASLGIPSMMNDNDDGDNRSLADFVKGVSSRTSDKHQNDIDKEEEDDGAFVPPTSGQLVRRLTQNIDPKNKGQLIQRVISSDNVLTNRKSTWINFFGKIISVDTIFWLVRLTRQIREYSETSIVTMMNALDPYLSFIIPSSWKTWSQQYYILNENSEKRNYSTKSSFSSLTKDWIDALIDIHGHQIFVLGLFHADPHPGNIIVMDEGKQLGLIDFGQCKQLTEEEQYKVARLILCVANNNDDNMEGTAAAFRELGIQTKNNSTEFIHNFAKLMFGPLEPKHMDHEWHKKFHSMDKVTYFPKELSMVYRTTMLLRGLGVSLQLNCNISEQWKHYAENTIQKYQKGKKKM